ncbi:Regulator of nonsense transcripts 3A [Heterocephalus glaber]|uniref:Regulator of nonsense transcripts 3A n=1 Tax=Heterocephalus glaber TaxID=10181 RepID=G5AVU4_HETGA|nr:Regulator of nonsense transcripts 3A [Heterocephalus glaber]
MRSEETFGGLSAVVTAQSPGGREKLSAAEVQFHRESPRREPRTPPASSGSGGGTVKPREEKRTVLSKVVLRRLPPGLTKEQLEEQLRPLPAHDYFEVAGADRSLYPHLYSRAYINFRNPDDILLFRDRFDGYVFMSSKGLEYPAVVEFAPFQKIVRRKLKKRDSKTGGIEDDPEYKQFLETYSMEEERTSANPEILLGEIEAKTRELVARRTTPLLDYIKNRKLEKQRIREEKREERRRRELEKKRLQEEEKRKRREEESYRRKEADKQKTTMETEVRIKLLKKPEKEEEPDTEKQKERGEEVSIGDGEQETCAPCTFVRARPSESPVGVPREKSHDDNDKEQRDMERRIQGPETPECHSDDVRKHSGHSEFDRFPRRNEDELRWQDRGKKKSQDGGIPVGTAESPAREQEGACSPALGRERPGSRAL